LQNRLALNVNSNCMERHRHQTHMNQSELNSNQPERPRASLMHLLAHVKPETDRTSTFVTVQVIGWPLCDKAEGGTLLAIEYLPSQPNLDHPHALDHAGSAPERTNPKRSIKESVLLVEIGDTALLLHRVHGQQENKPERHENAMTGTKFREWHDQTRVVLWRFL
jgi:hypothetical protein